MRVIVSAFSPLSTDQRIEKVCQTLHQHYPDLHLIGNDWGDASSVSRPYEVSKIALKSKILRRAYVEFNYQLYQKLLAIADKNTILHANDLDALLPNYWVSQKLGIPLVYDSHEIFTEMPSLQGRWTRYVWLLLERLVLPKVAYMITASHSYAAWFRQHYGQSPVVVQNFPYRQRITKTKEEHQPKIVLYQGVINPFRGIDKAIEAMAYLQNVEFLIAGEGPKKKEYEALTQRLGLEHRVHFLGRLSPQQLRELTPTADVGLSIEENGGMSYFYSLPNKVADYIQARTPLVMSKFPEMQKINQRYRVGEVLHSHTPEAIAEAIQKVLNQGQSAYQEALETAAHDLCWENEAPKILQLYNTVIAQHHA